MIGSCYRTKFSSTWRRWPAFGIWIQWGTVKTGAPSVYSFSPFIPLFIIGDHEKMTVKMTTKLFSACLHCPITMDDVRNLRRGRHHSYGQQRTKQSWKYLFSTKCCLYPTYFFHYFKFSENAYLDMWFARRQRVVVTSIGFDALRVFSLGLSQIKDVKTLHSNLASTEGESAKLQRNV